ncbi:SixA phosphatase family protein [Streptomyces sp. P1-3]|uniref:SixA phosphatase family protein n=1 Tax=Streptomyces sp. P1-3 TaxID=3421658 RepID=UPI003D35B95B
MQEVDEADVRWLVLLRHAKSAWPDGVDDQERPLAPRGRRDAPAAGRWLRDVGRVPDLAICSPARRTRETWELAARELGPAVPPGSPEHVVGGLGPAVPPGSPEPAAEEFGAAAPPGSPEPAAEEFGAAAPPVSYEPRLYAATAPALIDVVRETPAALGTLLLIGHNPGMQELTLRLAGDAVGDALERAEAKFPTSAIAVLAWHGTWSQLAPGRARLVRFAVPRGAKR